MTLTRWWTPAGKVPVEHLLRVGPDPQKDLGLALFAVHKAGAEACELVAQTAVADEMVLAAALAETRESVAPPAVQVISKGVDSPQYAGLLLADLLDDAESAALSLYRSCLAKSVAPPIAAQRVGMVFGVPARELGQFSKLATDPKSNPAAVQDAADRALFDYVARVVTEEYVPAKEEVSKAPVREYHGDDPEERDQQGRFARLRGAREEVLPGLSLQDLFNQAAAPKQVATPVQEQQATPGPPEVATRQTRQTRKVRQTRKTRSTSSTEAPAEQLQAQRLTAQTLSAPLLRQQLSQQELVAQQLHFEQAPMPMPLSGKERAVPDLLTATEPHPFLSQQPKVGKSVSFILTAEEFLALTRKAKDAPDNTHVMRVGGLVEYAGKAQHYQDEQGRVHENHRDALGMVLDITKAGPRYKGQPDLVIGEIPVSELLDTDVDTALKQAKLNFLDKAAQRMGRRINPASEVVHVQAVPDKDRRNVMKLIWRPPPQDRRTVDRPIPRLVELVVLKDQVRGHVDVEGRIELDPNAPVRMKSLFSRGPDVPGSDLVRQAYWDNDLKAVRTIVTVLAADEGDVSKAVREYHGDDPEERDERGRFARLREASPRVDLQALFDEAVARHGGPERVDEPAARRTRGTRSTRKVARVRSTTPSGAPALAAPKLEAHLGREQLHAQLANQQLARQKLKEQPPSGQDDLKDLLFLDDDTGHSVLTPEILNTIFSRAKYKGYVKDGAVVPLTGAARMHLAEQDPSEGSTAELDLMSASIASWNKAQGRHNAEDAFTAPPEDEERPILKHVATDEDELAYIASFLMDQMDQDQSLSMLRVKMATRDDGRVSITVTGNAEVLPEIHVVSYGEDVRDPDEVERIVAGKTYRMQNRHSLQHYLQLTWNSREAFRSGKKSDRGRAQDVVANPHVRSWRAE